MAKNGIAALQKQIENLEDRKQIVASEHARALAERREATLANAADPKLIARANARVAEAVANLSAIDDGLDVVRAKLAEAQHQLNDERDRQQREGRSREILAHVSAVERTLAGIEQPMADAIAALTAAAPAGCPEAQGAAFLLSDIATQVSRERPRLRMILEASAKAALEPPPPKVQAPPPRGLLVPQPGRAYELRGVPEWPPP